MTVEWAIAAAAPMFAFVISYFGMFLHSRANRRRAERERIVHMPHVVPPPVRSADSRMKPPPGPSGVSRPSQNPPMLINLGDLSQAGQDRINGLAPISGNITFTGDVNPFTGTVFSRNEIREKNLLAVRAEVHHGGPITRPKSSQEPLRSLPINDPDTGELLGTVLQHADGTTCLRDSSCTHEAQHPPEVQAVLDESSMEAAARRWDAEFDELVAKHEPPARAAIGSVRSIRPRPSVDCTCDWGDGIGFWSGDMVPPSRIPDESCPSLHGAVTKDDMWKEDCYCTWTRVRFLESGHASPAVRIPDARCTSTHRAD